mmetsp:Transcript_9286/g.20082  ORF Transcript_9286/g.20082 Transcript_9286/m.20082 type:complete len:242 (+) Transcript_9286:671-1396(+)
MQVTPVPGRHGIGFGQKDGLAAVTMRHGGNGFPGQENVVRHLNGILLILQDEFQLSRCRFGVNQFHVDILLLQLLVHVGQKFFLSIQRVRMGVHHLIGGLVGFGVVEHEFQFGTDVETDIVLRQGGLRNLLEQSSRAQIAEQPRRLIVERAQNEGRFWTVRENPKRGQVGMKNDGILGIQSRTGHHNVGRGRQTTKDDFGRRHVLVHRLESLQMRQWQGLDARSVVQVQSVHSNKLYAGNG